MSLGILLNFNTSTPAQPLSKGCRWQPVRTQVKSRLSCENERSIASTKLNQSAATHFSHIVRRSRGCNYLKAMRHLPSSWRFLHKSISLTSSGKNSMRTSVPHQGSSKSPTRAHSAKAASVEKGSILGFADSVPTNPVYPNLSLSRLESAQGKDLEAAKPPQSDSSPPLTSGHSSTS